MLLRSTFMVSVGMSPTSVNLPQPVNFLFLMLESQVTNSGVISPVPVGGRMIVSHKKLPGAFKSLPWGLTPTDLALRAVLILGSMKAVTREPPAATEVE